MPEELTGNIYSFNYTPGRIAGQICVKSKAWFHNYYEKRNYIDDNIVFVDFYAEGEYLTDIIRRSTSVKFIGRFDTVDKKLAFVVLEVEQC